jgi:hypothetical protein
MSTVRKLGVIVTVALVLCISGTSEAAAMTPGHPRLSCRWFSRQVG